MFSLQKLAELPRSQRLRKAAKIVGDAEHKYIVLGKIPAAEVEYLGSLVKLLVNNEGFSEAPAEALAKAQSVFVSCGSDNGIEDDGGRFCRALNAVYHILLAETGRYPSDWDFIGPSGALDSSKRNPFPGMQVYLEDIRSPFNVGSMFRVAESFGAEKVWLSPLCADPRHKRAERTAMGCVDILPWERLSVNPFTDTITGLFTGSVKANYSASSFPEGPFFALETGGISLADFPFPSGGIIIAGSEELGVSPEALSAADASLGRVSIPSYGAKGSLNVSVAFGIVMQAWAAALHKKSG